MAIEVLSDLDWSDMNDCCEKCIHLHAAFEDVNLETPCDCICHTDKGEKKCGCDKHTLEEDRNHAFEYCPHHAHTQPESSWEKKEPWVSIAGALHDLYMDLPDSPPHTVLERIKGYVEKEIEAAEIRGRNTGHLKTFERGMEQGHLGILAELEGKLPKEEFVTDCLHGPNDSCDTDCTYQGRAISRNEYRKEILNIIKSIKGE